MIAPDDDFDGAPLLRREVGLDRGHGGVDSAWLHVSACGVYEATIGGRPVGDDVLSPGWSSFEWRHRYRSYDVSGLLGDRFVIGLALGNGWYRGRLGWDGLRALYGDELAAIAELEIIFVDGHVQLVPTDEAWRAGPSDTVQNDLYDGQTIDARRRDAGWLVPGASLDGWGGVHAVPFDAAELVPSLGPPVVRHEAVRPVEIRTSPSGRTLVDFGQNLVGWLRFTVQGDAGSTITVRHAEVLEDGELGVRLLRTAKATDRFVLSGGIDAFEPTKTFHGFRYIDLEGWPGEITTDDLEAVVVHSDLRRTGTFECSHELLNQFHRNVVWGQRGNFLDVPTDCPQRDERLGWTGDIAVFAPTAAYLYDVSGFLAEWLVNLDCEQAAADGLVPLVVPDALKYQEHPAEFPTPDTAAIWSDAAAWVPWALWQAYGDREALARQFPAMLAHARRVERMLSPAGLWDSGFQFGDWLDPTAPPDQPWAAKADTGVVATACAARTFGIVAELAAVLGAREAAADFAALRERTRAAFREHYVSPDGLVRSDCQTVYALAVVFGLLEPAEREAAGRRLAELAAQAGYTVSTGFAGTPFVLDALSETGHLDEAYRMLTETGCPSWLYPVTMGATTVWERWDSMLPDGSINPGEMTSFNHYALGAVADWMHRVIGGIAPLEPGYAAVRVAPRPGGGITWARASLDTPSGRIATDWSLDHAGRMTLDLEVPPGAVALVELPGQRAAEVGEGRHRLIAEPVGSGPSPTRREEPPCR